MKLADLFPGHLKVHLMHHIVLQQAGSWNTSKDSENKSCQLQMEDGLNMFVHKPLYQADVLRVHRGHGAVVRAAMHGVAGESHFCFSNSAPAYQIMKQLNALSCLLTLEHLSGLG